MVAPPPEVSALTPTDAPLPPQEPPRRRAESMNTEYFLGSQADEEAAFTAFSEQIRAIQQRQARDHDQTVQRGFHAKAHGCLEGTLVPLADRDPRTRYGVFADDDASWPVWVRFSNGVGWSQKDRALDARGMAIKLTGVPGRKLMDDGSDTQDFLMTNSPAPVGRNAREFMRFAHTNARGKLPTILFALRRSRTVLPAIRDTGPIDSTLAVQYWSGGAYHLGAHQAVKFSARTCAPTERSPPKRAPDYLRQDLADAASEDLCFTLFVQLQVDPRATPIEDAAKVWTTRASPELPVAELRLPAQDFDTPEREALCTGLAFNPWHGLPAHQPMGHINRARRHVYAASQAHRGSAGAPPPAAPPPSSDPAPSAAGPAPAP